MTLVFAHRGAHLKERENTLAAFRAAVDLGVAGVELDVCRTHDGQLVVHHDLAIGPLDIARTRASELPDYIPTLEQAMEVLQSIKVNVEIKVAPSPTRPSVDESATIVRDVLDLLHSVDQIPSVIISCFDLLTCTQVRDYDTDVNVAWLVWDVLLDVALTKAHILGLNAVNPYFSLVTPETFEQSVDLGLELNVWTVNKESDMIALSALGVASIITDLPAKALSLLS